jgi:hypothetical protein
MVKSAVERLKENVEKYKPSATVTERLVIESIFELDEKLNSILKHGLSEVVCKAPEGMLSEKDIKEWENHNSWNYPVKNIIAAESRQNGVASSEKAKQDIKNIQNIKGAPKGGEVERI